MRAVLSTLLDSGHAVGAAAPNAAVQPPLSASDRLILSRERLRQAALDASNPISAAANQPADGSAMVWWDSLKSLPGASVVIEAVSSWWAQHPLRVASMLAADAAKTVVEPMAQRHPLGLIAGALVLGGLFAWSRPWRWILRPALFAGLLPQLVYKALTHVPVQSWMVVLASMAQEKRAMTTASALPVATVVARRSFRARNSDVI
jgi:hypothetical protein